MNLMQICVTESKSQIFKDHATFEDSITQADVRLMLLQFLSDILQSKEKMFMMSQLNWCV